MALRVNIKTKAALIAAVYAKSLKLSHAARQGKTVGEIVNLQSLDATRLGDSVWELHSLVSAPFILCLSLGLLYGQLGWAAFTGLGVMLLISPLQGLVGKRLVANQKVPPHASSLF